MKQDTRLARGFGLAMVVTAGLATLIGSESVEDDDTEDEPPVTVDFVIGSASVAFERDRGDDAATVTDLRLSGDYSADAGDALSLDREFVNLNTLTAFTVEVAPADPDDVLVGIVSLDVSETIDFRADRDPAAGRFTTLFDGTTTIVRAGDDLSGVGITVGGATSERTLGWGDFRSAQDDDDETIDVRMASYAYGVLETLYRVALLAEQTHLDIQDNRSDLEGSGLNEQLRLDCTTPPGGTAGARALVWRVDAPGTGEGNAGDGDDFEVQFSDCLYRGTGRYYDGGVALDDYVFVDDQPKRLAVDIQLTTLYEDDEEIGALPAPAADQPRLDGQLILDYQQQDAAR